MRRALTAFDAHQKKRLAIRELYSARIEDTVRGIRPMIGSKDRIIWMTYEEIVEAVVALDGASVSSVVRTSAHFFGSGGGVPAPSLPHSIAETHSGGNGGIPYSGCQARIAASGDAMPERSPLS